ncbi:MAG: hypothetical protein RLZZ324_905 [Candidatus Parcubacteria bacterium]
MPAFFEHQATDLDLAAASLHSCIAMRFPDTLGKTDVAYAYGTARAWAAAVIGFSTEEISTDVTAEWIIAMIKNRPDALPNNPLAKSRFESACVRNGVPPAIALAALTALRTSAGTEWFPEPFLRMLRNDLALAQTLVA